MRLLLPLFFIILLATNSAQANRCTSIFTTWTPFKEFVEPTEFRVYYARDKVDERLMLEDLALAEPLLTFLEKPRKTHVKVIDHIDAIPVVGGAFTMEIGAGKVLIEPKYAFDRTAYGSKLRTSIMLHEYGHAVFFANMARFNKVWGEYYKYATAKWYENFFGFSASEEQLTLNKRLSKLSNPYQELFADLISVLGLRDPEAMSMAIETIITYSDQRVEVRDFTVGTLAAHWSDTTYHGMLAPVRAFLWQRYFSKDYNKDRTAEIVARVFEVIANEVNNRFDNEMMDKMSPQLLNRRLLTALEAALRDYDQ